MSFWYKIKLIDFDCFFSFFLIDEYTNMTSLRVIDWSPILQILPDQVEISK